MWSYRCICLVNLPNLLDYGYALAAYCDISGERWDPPYVFKLLIQNIAYVVFFFIADDDE